jgi:beta-galactosidase/evolved beta-galactosidase subunit alpha
VPLKTPAAPVIAAASLPPVRLSRESNIVRVSGADFELAFDTVHATIASWQSNGQQLIHAGPRLNFWRALTNNDHGWDIHWGSGGANWRRNHLDKMRHHVEDVEAAQLTDQAVRIVARTRVAPPVGGFGFACEYAYTVYGAADVAIEVHGTPYGNWPRGYGGTVDPSLPKIGLQMTLPRALECVQWFGRGPGESYADTKQANRFGLWKAALEDLHTDYIYPQENGNRTDVRWVALTDRRGMGLLAVGTPWERRRSTSARTPTAQPTWTRPPTPTNWRGGTKSN